MEKPNLQLYPTTPGVYLFKDSAGHILYVGKAIRIRHRLASYFRPEESLTPKTRLMLQNAVSIDTLSTKTEKEALLLEASLIKKHRPRYNIVLRDDKEYLLFRIQTTQDFPRLEIIRKSNLRKNGKTPKHNKKHLFYGPFSSATAAKETWRIIHKAFPLRRCHDRAFSNRSRPCLYHHIGQCLAPCVLDVSKKTYAALIQKTHLLLTGRSTELVTQLEHDMLEASHALRFEDAAQLRDQITAVRRTIERQSVVLSTPENLDLIGLAQLPEGLALGIVFVRDGLLLDGRNFFWAGLSIEETPELLRTFLTQFYLTGQGTPPKRIVVPWLPEKTNTSRLLASTTTENLPPDSPLPSTPLGNEPLPETSQRQGVFQVDAPLDTSQRSAPKPATLSPDGGAAAPQKTDFLLTGSCESSTLEANFFTTDEPFEVENLRALEVALSEQAESSVTLSEPLTPDEDRLILMAISNAKESVKTNSTKPMDELLAAALHSKKLIYRIEAVDISHTAGRETKAGMVVFQAEQPMKSDYRQYSLDADLAAANHAAGDDYAALTHWARRRAAAGPPWADLVLVDGGKGQLAAVAKAFTTAGVVDNFVLASIAKARDEGGRTDRRAGNISDRIFLPGRSNPLPIREGSPPLLFLQKVRDTVHDYTIGRHRQARSKAALSGELTRLPGIGPKTAQLLYTQFGSLAAMAKVGKEGLMNVPGIGPAKAEMLEKRIKLLIQNDT